MRVTVNGAELEVELLGADGGSGASKPLLIAHHGGGGIGSILQQNINLLNYRAAAVQMLAIAIVVATMDWASSRLRERYV